MKAKANLEGKKIAREHVDLLTVFQVQMSSNPPEIYICRYEWYTGIHCLGAENRCLKFKTGTVPNFLEKEKSFILEIRKGQ